MDLTRGARISQHYVLDTDQAKSFFQPPVDKTVHCAVQKFIGLNYEKYLLTTKIAFTWTWYFVRISTYFRWILVHIYTTIHTHSLREQPSASAATAAAADDDDYDDGSGDGYVYLQGCTYVNVYKAAVTSAGREKHLAFGYPNKGNAAKNKKKNRFVYNFKGYLLRY